MRNSTLICCGLALLLAACQAAEPPLPTVSMSTPSTSRPTMTPLATVTSIAVPTATPDPLEALPPGTLPPGARVVFSTMAENAAVDCDDDGAAENIVLYREGDGVESEGYGLVVEADGTVHHLGGDVPSVLFTAEDPAEDASRPAEVAVYDHNGDRHTEIVVTGLLGVHASVVNIFGWDGTDYALLLNLVGEDGISVEKEDRVKARSDLLEAGYLIEKNALWDGRRYRVETRYDLLLELPDCLATERPPSCAVVAFYDLLGKGDAATAHTLLGPELRAEVPPDELVERFGRTLTNLYLEEGAQTEAQRVHVEVAAEGMAQSGTWLLQAQQGQWALVDSQPGSAMPALTEEGELRQLLGEEGYALTVPPGEEMLHWLTADLDGDGEDELAVRTCICDEAAEPGGGYLRILKAGVDGWERDLSDPIIEGLELVAELPADSSCCVFQPSFRVTQVRADGGLGLVKQSFCGAHATCLNLYTWDGTSYRAFYFSSSAMSITVNPDGTVVVDQRDYLRINYYDTGWTGVYRWDGSDYVLESVTFSGPTYVDEETGEPRPTGAVYAYYNAIQICLYEDDFYAAYAYLSEDFQAGQSYDAFAAGFANTVDVDVEEVTLIEESADAATVEAIVDAVDLIDGVEQETRYAITWQLTAEGSAKEERAWKLDRADVRIQCPTPTAALEPTSEPTSTDEPIPTATDPPAPTPTFTPMPTDTQAPESCSEPYFFEMPPGWEGSDLCPEGPAVSSWMAEQVFQGGRMLWVEQTRLIYVLPGQGQLPPEHNVYSIFEDTWTEDQPESDPDLTPPAGLYQPIRGFGKVWRENAWVREELGWATAPEQGYTSFYQCSQRRDTWEGNTYCYYEASDGRIIALQQYRRGRHWGFVQGE